MDAISAHNIVYSVTLYLALSASMVFIFPITIIVANLVNPFV